MANAKTVKAMVEVVLRNEPETRNSDVLLTRRIWERYYPQRIVDTPRGPAVLLESLMDLPREDNIKRIRAKFNEKGKYYPTDWKVAQARGIQENEWRSVLGYPAKERTIRPTRQASYMDPERNYNQGTLV